MTFRKAEDRLADWRWRVNHLYCIADKLGRLRPLRENSVQKLINNNDAKRKMILKYRQGGVTTNEVIKQLDFVLWHKNINACILAHDRKGVEKIFKIPKLAHDKMDPLIKPPLDRGGGSKYEMRFPSLNSKIYCDIESRGDTIHWLHISEAAFADPDRIKATLETVPPNGRVTFESTPNGMGNHFYQMWIHKSKRMEKLFFPWFYHDEYMLPSDSITQITPEEEDFIKRTWKNYRVRITPEHIAFRRAKQEDLGEMYPQEYPEDDVNCFLASGGAAMDLVKVKKLHDQTEDPIEQTDWLEIYKSYDKQRTYVIGADVAQGVRQDYSVATVFDLAKREQVAILRSNTWKPIEFARKLEELAAMYHSGGRPQPLISVERNNHGHAVLQHLEDSVGYPNLYYHSDGKVGWRTDSVTRPIMINTFIDSVEGKTVKLNSRDTLEECLTLVDNKGKIEAEQGNHDDCVVATAIAIQMCIHESSGLIGVENLERAILL